MNVEQTYSVIVGLVEVNDWAIFPAMASRMPADFPAQHLSIYLSIGNIVQSLVDTYEYTASPEFRDASRGKSKAFVAAKRRAAEEPVKRRKHHDKFFQALAALPASSDAYRLLDAQKHEQLDTLRDLIRQLRTKPVG